VTITDNPPSGDTLSAPTETTSKLGDRIFSGIQPTGRKHLGNYIGAIRQYVEGQDRVAEGEAIYCIVDLHAITLDYEPTELRARVHDTIAILLAAGLDPERCVLFRQSDVREHTELCWLLSAVTAWGDLNRMHQWKAKRELLEDRRGAFVSAGVRTFSKEGERVFVTGVSGEVQKLGFPLSVRITPVFLTVGYRFRDGRLIVPYVGAGASRTSYQEESEVAGETFDDERSKTGFLGVAGVEVGRGHLRFGAEVGWSTVADAIGVGGVSKVYGEDDLGEPVAICWSKRARRGRGWYRDVSRLYLPTRTRSRQSRYR